MILKRKIDKMLINWKNNPNKYPLIIRGARQIGKTYSISEFGHNNYKNYIGISENYSDFDEFYINKMMDLDNKYEKIINNTNLTVVSNSKIARFFRKVKAILTANVELSK